MQKVNGDSLRVRDYGAQLGRGVRHDVAVLHADGRELGFTDVKPNVYNTGKMSLQQTQNTTVACRVCFGTRFIGNRVKGNNSINITKCPHCKKSGRMKID